MRVKRRRVQLLMASVLVLQATALPAFAQEVNDPWEPFNRKMYALQQVLDRAIFGPVALGFGKAPAPIRIGLTNFASNLSEPVVFANDVLQGRIKTAAGTLGRFVLNSTVGLVGLIDVAKHNHLPHHDNGFGETLGRWGLPPGPYMFLPFIGPSDVRDTFGGVGNIFLNPITYAQFDGKTGLSIGTGVINGLNVRLQAEQALSNIQATSTDPYATLRSYFLQNRAAAIRGESAEPELPEMDLPDIPTDEGAGTAAPSTVPEGSVSPPGAPPAVPQPSSSGGLPALSGAAGALPNAAATPENPPAPTPAQPAAQPGAEPPPPAQPEAAPATGPKWLVEPDPGLPLRTAGGK